MVITDLAHHQGGFFAFANNSADAFYFYSYFYFWPGRGTLCLSAD
jgi:hypothetical protein